MESPRARAPVWFIDGRAYDLGPWLAKHPGGFDPLLQSEGTDCSILFRSYHLFGAPPKAMLARYEIPLDPTDPRYQELPDRSRNTFEENGFYATLTARVRKELAAQGRTPQASVGYQVAAVLMIGAVLVLTVPSYVFGNLWAAAAMTLLKILASVGPGHSMSHYCLFRRSRWNILLFRLTSPFLISNPAIWGAAHVQSHHVDTLTAHDLQDNYPIKRVQPGLPHRPYHRFQHVYWWLIYMFSMPLWAAQDLVRAAASLFTGKHAGTRFSLAQRVENLVVIAANLCITVGLPFHCLPFSRALIVFLVVTIPTSFFLSGQIAVNHEVPETTERAIPNGRMDWGARQALVSHNFGLGSAFALHFSGGLNMQIEHHLLPSVHYSHYPALAPVVRATIEEHGLPYATSRSFFHALAKHYRVLRRFSVP